MKTYIRYFLGLGLALGLLVGSLTPARAFVGVSVGIAPPPLPVCVQPTCPGLGYIWTPGYWAWDGADYDYYWVPGAWVLPPEIGFFWTPCWWGWANGAYCFNPGYWGPGVGFYGGVNYGYGYGGRGYDGGAWRNGHFYYNRAANNVGNIAGSRTFSRAVATGGSRVSYNGGTGGITARPTATELRAGSESHLAATAVQREQARSAANDPAQRNSANHGQPAVTGTTRAGNFRPATASASSEESRRTSESAFTGEPRIATERPVSHVAAANERELRTSGESAFTGESRVSSERLSSANSMERRSPAIAESHRASTEMRTFESRPHFSQSHAVAMPSHASVFHSGGFSHSAGFAHASVSHVGGGGGGSHGGGGGGRSGGSHHR